MGLFGRLFGSSNATEETPDAEVYMHRQFVNRLIIDQLSAGSAIVITFFQSTQNTLREQYPDENLHKNVLLFTNAFTFPEIELLRNFLPGSGTRIVLAERYPVEKKEAELIQSLRQGGIQNKVTGYCALDDLMMLRFGGEGVMDLMRKMGMSETECIQHSMITASIRNAQKKNSKKITYEQQAKSPDDWYRLNFPSA